MTIIRMYHTPDDATRPKQYREAWWDTDTGELIVHHGPVGETGTTNVENVRDEEEANILLDSFIQQNSSDQYIDAAEVPHETLTVTIRFKSDTPSAVEQHNAETFATTYSGLLGWRGLGWIEPYETDQVNKHFSYTVHTVQPAKAHKLVAEALKKTDFRADRARIERN